MYLGLEIDRLDSNIHKASSPVAYISATNMLYIFLTLKHEVSKTDNLGSRLLCALHSVGHI